MISRVGARLGIAHVVVLTSVALAGCEKTANPFQPAPFLAFEMTDLIVGTGTEAADGDVVTIENTVWLYDEDLPENKGPEAEIGGGTIVLGGRQVILGLDEGIPGMRVGGLRRIQVPASLAFGQVGSATIPRNSHLIVEVTLLDVQALATDTAPYSQTDVRVGTGTEAVDGSTVTVAFAGWLYDESEPEDKGLQFDTSGGFNVVVGAGQVIAGWDRGLLGMRVGGERRLIIPPDLAYGATGRLPLIPPDATLVFDLRMLVVVQ